MAATDRPSGDPSTGSVRKQGPALAAAWRALAHRAAVAGGCAAAIVSLWHHVPLSTVALRGGAAWFTVLVTARLGWLALSRALTLEARREGREASSQADQGN